MPAVYFRLYELARHRFGAFRCLVEVQSTLEGIQGTLSSAYAAGGNLHLVDPTERKEHSNEILGWVLRGLLDDIPDRVSDGDVKVYLLDLHAREVDPDELSRSERSFHRQS